MIRPSPLELEREAERTGDPARALDAYLAAVRLASEGDAEILSRSTPTTIAGLEAEAIEMARAGYALWWRIRQMGRALEAHEIDTARRLARDEVAQ